MATHYPPSQTVRGPAHDPEEMTAPVGQGGLGHHSVSGRGSLPGGMLSWSPLDHSLGLPLSPSSSQRITVPTLRLW